MGEHWLDMDPTLGRPPAPSPLDSSDKRRTDRNNRLIEMGVHPANVDPIRGVPSDAIKRCVGCGRHAASGPMVGWRDADDRQHVAHVACRSDATQTEIDDDDR